MIRQIVNGKKERYLEFKPVVPDELVDILKEILKLTNY
jgi:hypothetical protein